MLTLLSFAIKRFIAREVVVGDVDEMTQQELESALDNLALRWSKEPFLSNDYNEGRRYGELRGALKRRYGVSKIIEPRNEARDYFVVLDS